MLIIKVYATKVVPNGNLLGSKVDYRLIDEIRIKQVAKKGDGVREYEIMKPKGIKARITHIREDGYMPLLRKALGVLIGRKAGI